MSGYANVIFLVLMLKLKELRLLNNLTQTQLAEYLSCNQAVISKYERGEIEPSISCICKLADFFGCSADYLIGREDNFVTIPTTQTNYLAKSEEELISAYRKLNTEVQQKALALLKEVSK